MAYKGYELLKAIANNEIKEGSKFKDSWGDEYIYKANVYIEGCSLYRIEGDKIEVPDYSIFADNENDFVLIENGIDIDSIEEIETDAIGDVTYYINDLIKAVKQLNERVKQLEED